MTTDDRFGNNPGLAGNNPSQTDTSRSPAGATPGSARSGEYDDGLTVQDTSHGAEPRGETAVPGAASVDRSTGLGDRGRAIGDNRDGVGRDRTDAVTADESGTLISADKVVGTAVYDSSGERLGTIDSIMLNKRSGKVAYAVMSFGGFLGIGERYHPLPWDVLIFDHDKGGYNVQHSADDLLSAPNYTRDEVSGFDYGSRSSEVDSYYGVDVGHGSDRASSDTAKASPSTRYGAVGTGVESADAIGSTTGAGSSGMASSGMGSNRNF